MKTNNIKTLQLTVIETTKEEDLTKLELEGSMKVAPIYVALKEFLELIPDRLKKLEERGLMNEDYFCEITFDEMDSLLPDDEKLKIS